MRKLMVLMAAAAWLSFVPQVNTALAEEASGTVGAIDAAKNTVTVDGQQYEVQADALEQLKEIKEGDKVRVTFSEGGSDKYVVFINKE